ncbi:hypothetical protein WA1_50335 [Scytonema hofmannii PCC 7110]|uniref:Uncharacterized protein n=1 Tax=Scytonema hofmannii PCC 7110 TaxID=128403 RepID=A0A139WR63_9CYAN|nr:hypothetical protein [Scytonema hofmannii]KYC34924.1 hypothetical protein WA1_50335 [Scytonema hofmannii PCC 7110]
MAKKNLHNYTLFDVAEVEKQTLVQQSIQTISPNTRKMMRVMAELGVNKFVFASLLEFSGVDINLVKYLAGPIMVSGSSQSQSLPPWLMTAIAVDRLDMVFADLDADSVSEIVSPSEVAAAIMTASLDIPIKSNWVSVYLWAGYQTLAKHKRLDPNTNFWNLFGDGFFVNYDTIKCDYESLARDLREMVVREAEKQGWGMKSRKTKHPSTQPKEETTIANVQLSLF